MMHGQPNIKNCCILLAVLVIKSNNSPFSTVRPSTPI